MSFWYEPKKEDLSLSEKGDEVDIYLGQDDFGAIYASVKVRHIREILKQLDK